MFLRYASSIIQVVPEDKLEKSHTGGQDSPIYEISEVNDYANNFTFKKLEAKEEVNQHFIGG